ncbi:MAG: DUF4360 domain-containing protein [Deltaproteobacteria bacterium]|nr:DUF4360 domain-containing protein [Deltaproteobacteria bacterium]
MKRVFLTTWLVMSLALWAEAGIWGSWIAGGSSCNPSNVSVIDNGNSLSVLFDAFSINMPRGDYVDGMSSRKTCTFRIALTPPSGFYLAGFKQLYSGGLIKSRRTSAQLNIRYNVGSVIGRPLPIVFVEGDEIKPEDPRSLFAKTYYNNLLVAACGQSTVYGINMSFSATRRTLSEYLIGGLESVDADFTQRVILIPEWALCP